MKFTVLLFCMICFSLKSQIKPLSKTAKPTVEKPIIHEVISKKKEYGLQKVTFKLGEDFFEDSTKLFEVIKADSSVHFAILNYSQGREFKTGETAEIYLYTPNLKIDSTDCFAPFGTFRKKYTKDSLAEGSCSVCYLEINLPNEQKGWYFPHIGLKSGAVCLGDTLTITDINNSISTGQVEIISWANSNVGSDNLPFVRSNMMDEESNYSLILKPLTGTAPAGNFSFSIK